MQIPYACVQEIELFGLIPCEHCGGSAAALRIPPEETPRGCGALYECICTQCGMTTGRKHSLVAAVMIWQRRYKRKDELHPLRELLQPPQESESLRLLIED